MNRIRPLSAGQFALLKRLAKVPSLCRGYQANLVDYLVERGLAKPSVAGRYGLTPLGRRYVRLVLSSRR
jgi:hypothetical protein